jgi:hypothetical protein
MPESYFDFIEVQWKAGPLAACFSLAPSGKPAGGNPFANFLGRIRIIVF